jgi:uncharacterized protein
MTGYFQLSANAEGHFMFRLTNSNHQVILTSPLYDSRQAARGGIESARKNSRLATRYVRKVKDESACSFMLLSDIGQIVGTSGMYLSRDALEDGIKQVMAIGATTVIKGPGADSSVREATSCHQTTPAGTRTISY